ncbi:hypothetical protein BG006_003639 [Podila minutissima]|uniref:Uncharacterized protein n=1 Tax=Podila minutissima TaxID=64525 RepID=A0A9P5SQA6_9FUNG|nr:hypothetical protein BG006_003639 [Podila minutissima]
MKDQQIFERLQSQYRSFDYVQDHDPDDIPLGMIHSKTVTVIHVRPEDRDDDDDDIFDGTVRAFSPESWSGKTLANGHHHNKHDSHERVGGKDGPGVARTDTSKWTDAEHRGSGSQEEGATEPSVATDSRRLGKETTKKVAILQVEDGEGSMSHFDQLFSPDKLAEEHRVGHDDQPQETKAKHATTRRKNSLLNSDNHNHNNNSDNHNHSDNSDNSTTNQTSKPTKEAILKRMFTNLQSPRFRASRTGSLLHGILKGSSSHGRADTSTLEDEQVQAMELGKRRARIAKIQWNGVAHSRHRSSSGCPSSSVLPRQRTTTGTPTYTIHDTPFYGIENVDISSARYSELRSRQGPNDLVERHLSESGKHDQNLNLKGKEKVPFSHDELRDHREHIWAIAHEHEYGAAGSGGGGTNGAPIVLEQGRYKRFSRLVPTTDDSNHPIPLSIMRHSDVQTQAAAMGQQQEEEEHPTRNNRGAYIPIPPENEPDTAVDRVQPPPPTVPLTQPALAPISQGIYGPDSFAESLQGSTVGQSQQEQEHANEDRRLACLAKWKKWLFVLMALLVVLVVVVAVLVPKKGGGGGGGGGDGGEQGGEEVHLEKGQDAYDEGRHEVTTKSTTSRVEPTATTKEAPSTGATTTTTATSEKPTTVATEQPSSSSASASAATPTTSTTSGAPSSSATTEA